MNDVPTCRDLIDGIITDALKIDPRSTHEHHRLMPSVCQQAVGGDFQ